MSLSQAWRQSTRETCDGRLDTLPGPSIYCIFYAQWVRCSLQNGTIQRYHPYTMDTDLILQNWSRALPVTSSSMPPPRMAHQLWQVLNGCLLFSVIYSANTSLYMSSRMLYGLAMGVPQTNWVGRQIHRLSLVVPRTGVPGPAVVVSAVAFVWLPFLQLKKGYAISDVSSYQTSRPMMLFANHK